MTAADLGGSAHIISSGKPKKEMPYVKLQNHHAVFEELLKNHAVNVLVVNVEIIQYMNMCLQKH